MIRLHQVSLHKRGRTVLQDLSLTLSESRIGIIGQNGSGKSSLAKLLNGLERPDSGFVEVAGQREAQQLRRHVGFVFQNPDNQIVFPQVDEDLAYGLKASGLSRTERLQRVQAMLAEFGLSPLQSRLTHELSGGEKQLIALLGVLIMQPEWIVLDEPTTLLDLRHRTRLLRHLDTLSQSLIIVSHDLEWMQQMQRLLLIHEGRLLADGAPEAVIAQYRRLCQC